MKTITAGITAGVTAAAGGIAAIGTAAVSAYADYEQLIWSWRPERMGLCR